MLLSVVLSFASFCLLSAFPYKVSPGFVDSCLREKAYVAQVVENVSTYPCQLRGLSTVGALLDLHLERVAHIPGRSSTFNASQFLEHIRGKRVSITGDSVALQMYAPAMGDYPLFIEIFVYIVGFMAWNKSCNVKNRKTLLEMELFFVCLYRTVEGFVQA
jgi:hypothetical protein